VLLINENLPFIHRKKLCPKINHPYFVSCQIFSLFFHFVVLASFRHSQANKQFISQLEEGQFEVVHPFQIRDKNERIGIDTRNYFLNSSVHYRHVTIVIRSNTLVGRLKLILNLNDYLFFNDTIFKTVSFIYRMSQKTVLLRFLATNFQKFFINCMKIPLIDDF
jgi:hypothetical protein